MRECSSRITVQFLDEIDHNHDSQLRKLLKDLREDYCWVFGGCTERKFTCMQYVYIIFILMCGNCLNFLLWVMIFVVVS